MAIANEAIGQLSDTLWGGLIRKLGSTRGPLGGAGMGLSKDAAQYERNVLDAEKGLWDQTKVLGGAMGRYMKGGSLSQITAKHAVLASPGIVGVGARYASGGTMTQTAGGERDIAGIPFI